MLGQGGIQHERLPWHVMPCSSGRLLLHVSVMACKAISAMTAYIIAIPKGLVRRSFLVCAVVFCWVDVCCSGSLCCGEAALYGIAKSVTHPFGVRWPVLSLVNRRAEKVNIGFCLLLFVCLRC
jgi:hypothetical protein